MTTHKGKCFCGAVEIEVQAPPEAMGYCHCSSCRGWSAAPVNAFTLWKPENVRTTSGAEHVAVYNKTPGSSRTYCSKCGGHLMTVHPPLGLVDVRHGRMVPCARAGWRVSPRWRGARRVVPAGEPAGSWAASRAG